MPPSGGARGAWARVSCTMMAREVPAPFLVIVAATFFCRTIVSWMLARTAKLLTRPLVPVMVTSRVRAAHRVSSPFPHVGSSTILPPAAAMSVARVAPVCARVSVVITPFL